MSKNFFINLERDTEKRFDLSKFINYDNGYDPLTSDIISKLPSLKASANYRITDDEFRPDRTSLKVFGDFQYWWLIMIYNSITDVEDYKRGMIIQIPSIDGLENYFFSLSTKQTRIDRD